MSPLTATREGTARSADGVPIRYAVSGDGEPPLVFVHCWTGDRTFNTDLQPTDVAANRRHAPQFEATIMAGVGHFPMLEAPERFNQHLAEAIARVMAASRAAA